MSEKKTAAAPVTVAPPAGYVQVHVDMPSFKPEPFSEREAPGSTIQVYKGKPLVAEILGARNFGAMKNPDGSVMTNEDGETRDQIAFLLKVEADVGVVDRDKKPSTAKPGDTILWFVTTKVRQAIMQVIGVNAQSIEEANRRLLSALNDGEYGLRFWCMPTRQTPHPKDANKKIWSYDFHVNPEPVKRTGATSLGRFFNHAKAPELAAAPAFDGSNGHTTIPAETVGR